MSESKVVTGGCLTILAFPPTVLCSAPPSWLLTKPRSQICASASPLTAGPPCCSPPARTATSKPGSWSRRQRVRPLESSRNQPLGLLFSLILRSPTLSADGGAFWSCEFVGAYRGLVPECCCISADGSLVAVGFQEVVTVWSATSWELLTTLSQPPNAVRSESELLECFRGIWADVNANVHV